MLVVEASGKLRRFRDFHLEREHEAWLLTATTTPSSRQQSARSLGIEDRGKCSLVGSSRVDKTLLHPRHHLSTLLHSACSFEQFKPWYQRKEPHLFQLANCTACEARALTMIHSSGDAFLHTNVNHLRRIHRHPSTCGLKSERLGQQFAAPFMLASGSWPPLRQPSGSMSSKPSTSRRQVLKHKRRLRIFWKS